MIFLLERLPCQCHIGFREGTCSFFPVRKVRQVFVFDVFLSCLKHRTLKVLKCELIGLKRLGWQTIPPKFWDILKFPSSISFQHFFAAKRNLRWSNDVRCCQPFWVVRIEILEPTKAQLSKAFGGFKYFLFSPLLGEMIQFDEHIFQIGWNHELENDWHCNTFGDHFTPSENWKTFPQKGPFQKEISSSNHFRAYVEKIRRVRDW